MHLVIDGHGADRQKLTDADFIFNFLDSFPDSIGMTKITRPAVYTYYSPKPEDWGVSGFVIIAESHISVHTFPDRDLVNIDVFSCKPFDVDKALNQVKTIFGLSDAKTWTLERGLEYLEPDTIKSRPRLQPASFSQGSQSQNE